MLALNQAGITTRLNASTPVMQLLDGRGGIPRDRLDGVPADVPRLVGRD
ncbi:hypothetical protein HEP86_32305 [Streptomyces sp. RPA4-5]|nr:MULTISPECIES: hypothetical protein [Streptomyces]MCX4635117.1 hypothetical protein [Streptomyces platensis]QIY58328.1 hypothetical protein HEP86_32305 [Streptomyces sp. RPA4-5]WJY41537.1 hypothetical protein QT196_32105 [Streptomyces sp. P9-2B-2]